MASESLDYSHLYTDEYKNKVYLPSEDTFFFVDILNNDFNNIIERNPQLILELGCGSGYISTHLLKLFKSSQNKRNNEASDSMPFVICVDINKYATLSINYMMKSNNLDSHSDSVCMDMFDNFTNVKFDMIIFNPPYVPGETEDVTNVIDMAWNGGKDGSETIKRFLNVVDGFLEKEGSVYLLLEQRNNVDEILEIIKKRNFISVVLGSRKVIGEHLTVIKFFRP